MKIFNSFWFFFVGQCYIYMCIAMQSSNLFEQSLTVIAITKWSTCNNYFLSLYWQGLLCHSFEPNRLENIPRCGKHVEVIVKDGWTIKRSSDKWKLNCPKFCGVSTCTAKYVMFSLKYHRKQANASRWEKQHHKSDDKVCLL